MSSNRPTVREAHITWCYFHHQPYADSCHSLTGDCVLYQSVVSVVPVEETAVSDSAPFHSTRNSETLREREQRLACDRCEHAAHSQPVDACWRCQLPGPPDDTPIKGQICWACGGDMTRFLGADDEQ